jgi:hypothetical protein
VLDLPGQLRGVAVLRGVDLGLCHVNRV